MKTLCNLKDFDFHLPENLIAQYPLEKRSESRLMYLNRKLGTIEHHKFCEIVDLLSPEDLLVFNDTKVIPARLMAQKITGGKVEILFSKRINSHEFLAYLGANKPLKIGTILVLETGSDIKKILIKERNEDLFLLKMLAEENILEICEKFGHMPLPPYIDRHDGDFDKGRYQTIYAKNLGAIAAPTAGLHFDEMLLKKIASRGIDIGYVTLHVGAGTFQPVRVENIKDHKMHSEEIFIDRNIITKIIAAKKRGGRVIAVGTTVARSLETIAQNEKMEPFFGSTNIFIYPGFKFKCVDALLTNFHLPKSTLLMLVSAFSGYENTMRAYNEAIKEKYRFFSYGDAMFC